MPPTTESPKVEKPQGVPYTKILVILAIVVSVLFVVGGAILYFSILKSDQDVNTTYTTNNSTYENTEYNFKFTYPEGSVFANANPETGFIVRLFIPSGETIANDQENIGIYVNDNARDIETELKGFRDSYFVGKDFSIKEVKFGGQKGYRVVFTSNYTAQKGTKELVYATVRNGTLYMLNYFPVGKSLPIVDNVASSFQFTK